jgi:hypothetical protein
LTVVVCPGLSPNTFIIYSGAEGPERTIKRDFDFLAALSFSVNQSKGGCNETGCRIGRADPEAIRAEALPDDNPAVLQLSELFGITPSFSTTAV